LLVPNHIKGIIKVIWDQLALLLICSLLSPISVALFALLSLLIGFSIDDRSSLLTLKTRCPRRGGKTGKREKPGG